MWCLELSSALLSWGQLPTFNFRGFQRHEVSESSVAMTFVRSGTSSFRGHNRFPPVWQCACLHGVPLATWTAPPTAPGPTFLDSALSPLDATSVLLKLCSRHSLPFSATLSSLSASSFFPMNRFGQMSHGFFTGREESITTTCFAICL